MSLVRTNYKNKQKHKNLRNTAQFIQSFHFTDIKNLLFNVIR